MVYPVYVVRRSSPCEHCWNIGRMNIFRSHAVSSCDVVLQPCRKCFSSNSHRVQLRAFFMVSKERVNCEKKYSNGLFDISIVEERLHFDKFLCFFILRIYFIANSKTFDIAYCGSFYLFECILHRQFYRPHWNHVDVHNTLYYLGHWIIFFLLRIFYFHMIVRLTVKLLNVNWLVLLCEVSFFFSISNDTIYFYLIVSVIFPYLSEKCVKCFFSSLGLWFRLKVAVVAYCGVLRSPFGSRVCLTCPVIFLICS